jgi:SAM-dependent methyltransferase
MHAGEVLDEVWGDDVEHTLPGSTRKYQVLRCHPCLSIHVFPLPSEQALARYYAQHFYQDEKPDMIAQYEADAAWWGACMHGPTLNSALDALRSAMSRPPRLLDIGAGPGLLLRQAHARGWQTHAIEPSPPCAARLRLAGHQVWEGSLTSYIQALPCQRASFDVVTMWETLEHVPCPEDTLLQAYALLRPGGVVAICVPNEYTLGQKLACHTFGLPPWWLAPPQHLTYWTPKFLQLLARRCGFTPVHMRMTYPMVELLMLEEAESYVGNAALGRACHQHRMAYELHEVQSGRWAALEAEYVANVEHRIGREVVGIFRKDH